MKKKKFGIKKNERKASAPSLRVASESERVRGRPEKKGNKGAIKTMEGTGRAYTLTGCRLVAGDQKVHLLKGGGEGVLFTSERRKVVEGKFLQGQALYKKRIRCA